MKSRQRHDPLHDRYRRIAQRKADGISWRMPTKRPTTTTPDLFSASPTAKAPESPAVLQGKALPDNSAALPRYLLPKDLAGALKRLDDTELDAMLAAVTREALRRGRLPRASASKALAREDAGSSLTTGKLNAVVRRSRLASSRPRLRGSLGCHCPRSKRRSPLRRETGKPGADRITN